MIGEFDIAGVFVSPLLLCLLAAFLARILIGRVLEATGIYRAIWHQSLFSISLFFVLVGAVFALLQAVTS
ncbi:DUF1656 domain-containing protein [Parvibaculum sedimenti]|uniref:DUF1656 domain-containing protein n=2 Tax=Parvibaculum sedimenti TaxID=2608632 RepID=A0A6N6VFH7_9HYPH|nr:DUF1656 domain-containing protein [Parvibaculum sedimenti]KAB7738452.1 DUF1656 domain-containing protein [Parvibaculum sedimenti]